MNKLHIWGASALLALSSATATAAVLDQWGTEASTAVADCPSFCTNFNFGPFGGGVGTDFASSQYSESRGSARSEASLTGGASTPVLKAEAFANPAKKGAFSTAFGVQGYTYSGADTTLTLDANLFGSLFDPDGTSFAKVQGVVAVFQVDPFVFYSDEATLVLELGAQYRQTTGGLDARMQFDLFNTGSINQNQSISFDVQDGDQFYIWALLDATATSSIDTAGSAEAFNSLTMSFQDSTGLQAASVVPVPAAAWLFGSGLLGLVGIARRRKSA